jgi:hypothetical protein
MMPRLQMAPSVYPLLVFTPCITPSHTVLELVCMTSREEQIAHDFQQYGLYLFCSCVQSSNFPLLSLFVLTKNCRDSRPL